MACARAGARRDGLYAGRINMAGFSRARGQLSGYIARDKFPVPGLSEHFSRDLHKCTMRKAISLELIHHPGRRVSEISVDAIKARRYGGRTGRLPRNVVVCGPDQRSLQLPNII